MCVCVWANRVGGMREQDDEAQIDESYIVPTEITRLDKKEK